MNILILKEVGQSKNFNNMYDIIEVTINGKKVNPNDIVVKWREWDGNEYSGEIESYAYAVAQCEVGMAEAGENW